MVTYDDILRAKQAIAPHVRHTPVEHSPALGDRTGATVHLKLENLQMTGSFKPRGPFNRLLAMSREERKKGVVAATAGNHGVGLSYAGMRLDVPVHIHIAEHADQDKLDMLRRHGATLHFASSYDQAHFNGLEMAKASGLPFVSPYNDPWVIAADGVVGLEIMDDLDDVDLVIVPVGGGGLIAGIALAMRQRFSNLEIWGVEAANSPTFNAWFRAREVVPVSLEESIGEGLAGYVDPDTLTWPIIRDHVSQMQVASETELVEAMRWMVTRHRFIVEPSGVAAVAAALHAGQRLRGRRVAVVISGGNVAWARFLRLVGPNQEKPA